MSAAGTQPITLITATPGGGKTAMTVDLMLDAVAKGRPVFVRGIPDLKVPHIPVPPLAEWTEMRPDPDLDGVEMPFFTFPPNSLIVLDEAQAIYRVRASGAKVPDIVAAFETVRHTGVTFILITQNPAFLDAHIRKLVGQHIHLRDVGLLGRWYYEWPECTNPDTFSSAPIKKKWSLPKRTFGLYKSSSMHIKRHYSLPPSMMILALCLLAIVFGVWRVYGSIDSKMAPPKIQPASVSPSGVQSVTASGFASPIMDGGAYLASFIPVVPGRPESAPVYEQLRQVKDMPRVVAAVCSSSRCVCYTQQGTNAGLDSGQCREWLRSPPFDPYRDPAAPAQVVAALPVSDKLDSALKTNK